MAEASPHIHILLLTDEMEIGGTQRQIVHIARSLDKEKFSPTVAYFCQPSFLLDELEAEGIPVVHIPKHHKLDIPFLARLTRFLRDGRFQIMHCFSFTGELWGAISWRLLPRHDRPVLLTSMRSTYDWYSWWQWWAKRWVSRQSHGIIANSRAGAEAARKKTGMAPSKIHVVPNGVAWTLAEPAPQDMVALRQSLGLAPDTVLGVFAGRLVVHKNLPLLLRALTLLAEDRERVQLLIVGDGPLMQDINAAVKALGLTGCVQLTGYREDTQQILAACDFVVLPSLREGLSNVLLEAMLAGKPVIASDAGGNPELVVHEQTGLLFASNDAPALAAALRRLAGDQTLRRLLGQAGRQRARQNFSMEAMTHAMSQCYQRGIAHGPGGTTRPGT